MKKDTSHRLNTQQQVVVDQTTQNPKRHMVVVAGPGTGKTEVLTLRAQTLIDTGVSPTSLACISFTQASAQEMRTRLARRTGIPAHQWHIHTFHSFFLHLLKSQVHATPFQFVSPDIWEHHFVHILMPALMGRELPHAISKSDACKLALETLSSHHAWLLHPPEDPIMQWISSLLHRHYTSASCPLISVTDLECFFWLKLQTGSVPFFPYDHLLMDEFQDTSKIQYDIIHTYLERSPVTLFAVGDAKQSIYAFRRARVENFEALQETLQKREGVVVYLIHNYRSQEPILELANQFQQTYLSKISDPPLQPADPQKNQEITDPEPQFTPLDVDTFHVYLAGRCLEAFQENRELAILFRTKEDLKTLYRSLPETLLPAVRTSSDQAIAYLQSPFARGLALGYLASLFPKQSLYTYGWENSLWAPSPEDSGLSFSLNAQNTLRALLRLARAHPYRTVDIQSVHILMSTLTEAAGVFLPDFPYQLENYLLHLLDPLTPTTQALEAPKTTPKKKLITLSTLHGAKGLEFDHVILAMTGHSIPRTKTYPSIFEEHGQWGIRYRQQDTDTNYTFQNAYEALQKIHKQRQLDEEFRLLYVGITRAKRSLEICFIENEIPKPLHPWLSPPASPSLP